MAAALTCSTPFTAANRGTSPTAQDVCVCFCFNMSYVALWVFVLFACAHVCVGVWVCFGACWAWLAGVTGLKDCFKSSCSFQMDSGSLFSHTEAAGGGGLLLIKCHSGSYSGFIGYMITGCECDPAWFIPMKPETPNCKKNQQNNRILFLSFAISYAHECVLCTHTHKWTHTDTPSSEMAMKPDHRSILIVAWEGSQELIPLMPRDQTALY